MSKCIALNHEELGLPRYFLHTSQRGIPLLDHHENHKQPLAFNSYRSLRQAGHYRSGGGAEEGKMFPKITTRHMVRVPLFKAISKMGATESVQRYQVSDLTSEKPD